MRRYYLDNLRVFLTALLIFHHTAIAYGASGSWYYVEVHNSGLTATSAILTLFTAVNQSFFLGLFFFLSGFFTPSSLERKGAGPFWRDRLIRLGIPLAVYAFGIGPALIYGLEGHWPVFAFGTMWFVEALLYFTAAYTLWWMLLGRRQPVQQKETPLPGDRTLLLSAIAVGVGAFILRLLMPVGQNVLGMQLGYFSSYVFLFFLGAYAHRRNWLEQITTGRAKRWLWVTLAVVPLMPVTMLTMGDNVGLLVNGGLNFPAVLYAIWEPFVAWGICLGLLVWFRSRWNVSTPLNRELSRGAFTAYVIHPAVVVGFSLLLKALSLPPFAKFLVVGALAVTVSFGAGALLTRVPGLRRVL